MGAVTLQKEVLLKHGVAMPGQGQESRLDRAACLYFRDQLRQARARALEDSEGFLVVVQTLERLGKYLNGPGNGLGRYRDILKMIAQRSPRVSAHDSWDMSFDTLFDMVRTGRNDAVHEGAFARRLALRCVDLALRVEEGLMADMNAIEDFMVRSPVGAELWHPVGFARQQMLLHSFSFLPIRYQDRWQLLSDWSIATYLDGLNDTDRGQALSCTIQVAIVNRSLRLTECAIVSPEMSKDEVLARMDGRPALVVHRENRQLCGIVTPFDLL